MTSRHVALIRGINVGRAKRVAMSDLRELMEGLGYGAARTVLNSGNMVFTAGREPVERIGARIEGAMGARLGVSAAVTVLTSAAFVTAVEENVLADSASDPARLLVAFCGEAGRLQRLEPLTREAWGAEAFAVGSVAAYLWCPAGILASRLLGVVGRTLGETATTRNWSTVGKVHALL